MKVNKYKCDRCGKEINKPYRVTDNLKKDAIMDIRYFLFGDYDFCDKCGKEAKDLYLEFKKKINTWMKNKE